MSAHRTVSSPATSQSLTWLLSSPPTYWMGLATRESRGSSRSKSDSTGMRGLSERERDVVHPNRASGPSESGEPDLDLALGRLGRIGAVHEVLLDRPAPVAAEITPDGAGQGLGRV